MGKYPATSATLRRKAIRTCIFYTLKYWEKKDGITLLPLFDESLMATPSGETPDLLRGQDRRPRLSINPHSAISTSSLKNSTIKIYYLSSV
jgi:hypothetical protein